MTDVQSPFLRNSPLPNSASPFSDEVLPASARNNQGSPTSVTLSELLHGNLVDSDPRLFALRPLTVNPITESTISVTPSTVPGLRRLDAAVWFETDGGFGAVRGINTDTTAADASDRNFIRQIDEAFIHCDYLMHAQPLRSPIGSGWLSAIPVERQRPPGYPNLPANGWPGNWFQPPPYQSVNPFLPQGNGYPWTNPAEHNRYAAWPGNALTPANPYAPPYNYGWGNTPYWAQPVTNYPSPFLWPTLPDWPINSQNGSDSSQRPSVQPEIKPQPQPNKPDVKPQPDKPNPKPSRPKVDEYRGVSAAEAARFDRLTSSSSNRFTEKQQHRAISMDAQEKACFDEINRIRGRKGLSPLDFSPTVKLVSDLQAKEQADTQRMKHSNRNPQLANHFRRLHQVKLGRDTMHDGENAAMGATSGTAVAQMWMGDAGHRRPILDPYLKIGSVSRAFSRSGTPYWTFNASTG
jgi:uncharacterized protein YkwD